MSPPQVPPGIPRLAGPDQSPGAGPGDRASDRVTIQGIGNRTHVAANARYSLDYRLGCRLPDATAAVYIGSEWGGTGACPFQALVARVEYGAPGELAGPHYVVTLHGHVLQGCKWNDECSK